MNKISVENPNSSVFPRKEQSSFLMDLTLRAQTEHASLAAFEKEEKKEESSDAKRAELFQALKSTLSDSSAAPSPQNMAAIAGALAGILAHLEELTAQAGQKDTEAGVASGNANLILAQDQVKQAQENLQKYLAAKEAADNAGLFSEILGDIVSAIMATIAVVTGQVELFVITAALFLLTNKNIDGGLLDKLMGCLSDELQKAGLSPKLADILSSIMVVVVIIAACVVTASGGQLARTVSEEGATLGAEVAAETTAETASTTTTDGSSFWGKLTSCVKSLQGLSPEAKFALLGAINGIQNTGLITKTGTGLQGLNINNKYVDALTYSLQGLEVILSVISMLSLGGESDTDSLSLAKARNSAKMTKFLELGNKITPYAQTFAGFGNLAMAGANITNGVTNLKIADLEEAMGTNLALQQFYDNLIKIDQNSLNGEQTLFTRRLQAEEGNLAELIKAESLPGQTLAQVLAHQAV